MYSIAVKIAGIETRRRNAGLLHIVIGFFMIINAANFYRFTSYKNFISVFPFLLIGSFSLFYGLFRKKIDWTAKYNFWLRMLQAIAFAVLGLLLTESGRPIDYIGVLVFSILTFLLLFSEKRIFLETIITLDENGIKIPGDYRDHLVLWTDLSEVVIREDFITLFHVKQKYLQYQVKQDLSTLEVAKMNAYCKEMTGSANSEN